MAYARKRSTKRRSTAKTYGAKRRTASRPRSTSSRRTSGGQTLRIVIEQPNTSIAPGDGANLTTKPRRAKF